MTDMKSWCDSYLLGLVRANWMPTHCSRHRHAEAQYPPPHMFDNWHMLSYWQDFRHWKSCNGLYATWHAKLPLTSNWAWQDIVVVDGLIMDCNSSLYYGIQNQEQRFSRTGIYDKISPSRRNLEKLTGSLHLSLYGTHYRPGWMFRLAFPRL